MGKAIFVQLLKWQYSCKLLLLYFLSEGKYIFFNFLRKSSVMTESWKYEILLWVTA